jgi:hypothetical protein
LEDGKRLALNSGVWERAYDGDDSWFGSIWIVHLFTDDLVFVGATPVLTVAFSYKKI